MGFFDPPSRMQICFVIAFQLVFGVLSYLFIIRPLLVMLYKKIEFAPVETLAEDIVRLIGPVSYSGAPLPDTDGVLIARVLISISHYALFLADTLVLYLSILMPFFTWWFITVVDPKIKQFWKWIFLFVKDLFVDIVWLLTDLLPGNTEFQMPNTLHKDD